ncbi:MAG: hypothetical protein H7141_14245 [Burkholderiales bacterium]|nr:hypothetical protein [Bacteroidia bacterium]
MRKFIFCMLYILCSVYYGQQQYIAYFTPPTDFSDYSFSMYGPSTNVTDNSGIPRSCTFYNGLLATPAVGMYYKWGMIDAQAQTLAYSYDSLVFKFKVKTNGYAKNFRIRGEFLQNTGNFPYSLTKNYNGLDSLNIRIKVGFITVNPFNWKVWLEKQDTTLNNFTVKLSDLDIKGYLHYGTVGLNDFLKSEGKIYWNNETIFFDEKWMNKKYWINDVYGKIIYSGIVNSTQEKLNLGNGLYILNTEYSSQKMIISSN